MTQKQIAEGYVTRFPNTPSLTLAKLIYKENPESFLSVDGARGAVRKVRGTYGADRRHMATAPTQGPGKYNPFDELPEGLTSLNEWKPHFIQGKKVLHLADVHIPYHDLKAFRLALEYGHSEKIDHLFLNGDFLDFYSLSFFEKDPKQRKFNDELKTAREVLRIMRNAFPAAGITLKLGNHEERYERYMRVKAPELLGVRDFDLENVLRVKDYGVEIVGEKRIVKLGKLHAVHGHEFGKAITAPVNPARGLYNKGKENCIGAHHHQSSNHSETSMDGAVVSTWTVGCLCELHPEYAVLNKWNHGFAVVHIEQDGNFQVDNKKIINGRIYNS
jgi:predicted phosphodiesterase